MSAKKVVFETDPDKQMVTIPGPGGYEIKWAPGAVHIALKTAMSSHLMMPCDKFNKVPTAGLKKKEVTLHAHMPQPSGDSQQGCIRSGSGSARGVGAPCSEARSNL